MREIKFRAWDTLNKIMVYEMFMFRKAESYDNVQTDYVYYNEFRDFEDGIARPCEIMQFTGLLDKNGRDIYEDMTLRIKGVMGDNKEYKYDAIYKVNKITHAGVSISFVKLYSEEPDSVDNSIPIHLNLSFADGLCLDYRNANYSNLCLEDTHGGNIVSRRKWQGNHYTNDIEVIGDIFNNPELIA